MGYPESDKNRKDLVDGLLKQAHEQSRSGAQRSPFWREGEWRCEFHQRPGDERLKVFSGARCVHEESVQGKSVADRRAQELRRVVVQSKGAGGDRCLLK